LKIPLLAIPSTAATSQTKANPTTTTKTTTSAISSNNNYKQKS
jgi:hypothetical protein